MDDNIIGEKDENKEIGLHIFYYTFLKKRRMGVFEGEFMSIHI